MDSALRAGTLALTRRPLPGKQSPLSPSAFKDDLRTRCHRTRAADPAVTAYRSQRAIPPIRRQTAQGWQQLDGRRAEDADQRRGPSRHLEAIPHHVVEGPLAGTAASDRGTAILVQRSCD